MSLPDIAVSQTREAVDSVKVVSKKKPRLAVNELLKTAATGKRRKEC
jgi:hypothetical protein